MAVASLVATVIGGDGFTITPNAADYNSVKVNSTSAEIAFEVKNYGGLPTAPLTVSVSTSEFVVVADTCATKALPPGGSCTVFVSFKPTSPGQKSALLTVSEAPGTIGLAMLSGTAIP
jgi:hypothetical protein